MTNVEREINNGEIPPKQRKTAEQLLELVKKAATSSRTVFEAGKGSLLEEAKRLRGQIKK